MNEMEIFEYLDKECKPETTPFPNKIFNLRVVAPGERPWGSWGLFFLLLSKAFQKMRDTEGKSCWMIDATFFTSPEEVGEKHTKTKTEILNILQGFLDKKAIKYFSVEADSIPVKINAEFLYEFDN